MNLYLWFLFMTIGVSLLAFFRPHLMNKCMFRPYDIHHHGEWYRFFTYGLVHADLIHLLVNMWVLFIFGPVVEMSLVSLKGLRGELIFFLLYLGGLLFSPLISFQKRKNNPSYAAVGASGAISSIVFAFILMYPKAPLMIFPFPFKIPAFLFGLAYLIYSWYMAKKSTDLIGHDAHLLGGLYGILFMIVVEPKLILHFLSQLL